MMFFQRCRPLWLMLFVVLLLAACVPLPAEPVADLEVTAVVTTDAYPLVASATPTLPPYPWPTPPPTDPPEPTAAPTETIPPVPTLPPTPVVTPIPTAAPPLIPLPEGTTPQPFTLFWRDGEVIRSMSSVGGEPSVFLDPAKELALYLTPEEAHGLAWGDISPDGRLFALVLTEEPDPVASLDAPYPANLYLFNRESRELHLLVKYGVDPLWSPDGQRLAYRSTETGGLRIVEAVTGATNELYVPDRDNAHNVTDFAWSSDNRHLAVLDQVYFESSALFIIDSVQEQSPRLLIDSPSREYYPQWSPADDHMALIGPFVEDASGPRLWITNREGTEQRQLAHTVTVGGGGSPAWSPDGKWIAFSGLVDYEEVNPRYDLWLIDAAGTELKRLTFNQLKLGDAPGNDSIAPIWTPDGSQLIFVDASPDGLKEVWLLSLLDRSSRRLLVLGESLSMGLIIAR